MSLTAWNAYKISFNLKKIVLHGFTFSQFRCMSANLHDHFNRLINIFLNSWNIFLWLYDFIGTQNAYLMPLLI
jgi:hypothetical protein